ncbi:hypothetical protein M409DRAFT_53931 [Zasmidium cellare ATCC 36951]|uniref:Uncharacterized protein n=1 Tax=Zasmidium cellare ATCC 36951 TaxID=1080233 RepID=A0A6A6CJB9_ZASCE|nr:uncharacterized protein M409DRAFT_53931 [Zasmidium cellare ATCC 36951]KAF2167327.1 hypothetical protein M409DRAFT_53931 [Zasmidium cellare ATCC 36951]
MVALCVPWSVHGVIAGSTAGDAVDDSAWTDTANSKSWSQSKSSRRSSEERRLGAGHDAGCRPSGTFARTLHHPRRPLRPLHEGDDRISTDLPVLLVFQATTQSTGCIARCFVGLAVTLSASPSGQLGDYRRLPAREGQRDGPLHGRPGSSSKWKLLGRSPSKKSIFSRRPFGITEAKSSTKKGKKKGDDSNEPPPRWNTSMGFRGDAGSESTRSRTTTTPSTMQGGSESGSATQRQKVPKPAMGLTRHTSLKYNDGRLPPTPTATDSNCHRLQLLPTPPTIEGQAT